MTDTKTTISYRGDEDLNYDAYRYPFPAGAPLSFDENYRLVQLPLLSPEHQLCINEKVGTDYQSGRYQRPRYSLTLPVDSATLDASAAFTAMNKAMAEASFAPKIAWDICDLRAEKLHVTLASGFVPSELEDIATRVEAAMVEIGDFHVKLLGPYVGNKNIGRIYFPAYPEVVGGDDPIGILQEAVSRSRSRFYAMGYYNLKDELTEAEAVELSEVAGKWGKVRLAEIKVDELAIFECNDDLVLVSRKVGTIRREGHEIQMHDPASSPRRSI